jgi:hypothetical protein
VQLLLHPATKQEGKENPMSNADQLSKSVLMQFIGTEHWYRHALNREIVFTDGAKHIADVGGAYWLLDEIVLAQLLSEKTVAGEAFQLWRLSVHPGQTGTLTCENGNGIEVYRKAFDFTDFPAAGVTLYFSDNTILLPSEY